MNGLSTFRDLMEIIVFSVMLGSAYSKADIRLVIALSAFYIGVVIQNIGLMIRRSLEVET